MNMDDILYEANDTSGEMRDEEYEKVYKHLSHEKVFFTLPGYKKQGDGITGACPKCGAGGAHFFAHKKLRYGVCSNPDCNKRALWKDYVREHYNLKTEKALLDKLKELAGMAATKQQEEGGLK